jgi:hypothetical protein
MTSDIPDYTDDEARRRLLRLGEDRLTGAPASPYWPEHPSGWPGQPTVGWAPSGSPAGTSRDGLGSQNGPSPWPASPPQASAARSPASQRMPARRPARLAAKGAVASNALAPVIPSAAPFTMSPSALLPRKGQALSWTALILGLAAALSVGSGIFAALNSVEFTGHPFIKASHWASFVLFSIVVGLAATMLAVVALFVARPKLTATLALLLCLTVPWIAAVVGFKFGADAFGARASDELGHMADVAGAFAELLAQAGIDPGPYRHFLDVLFGG